MADSDAVRIDARANLAALDYPGTPAPGSGILDGDRFRLGRDPGRLDGRRLVIAVGANAAPAVLAGKLRRAGSTGTVAMVRAEVEGLAVGHSAHVSRGGYIPAGPYAADSRTTVVGLWLTDEQVAAIDATEPNYDRVRLRSADHPLRLEIGPSPASYDAYVSRWGVLGVDGVRLRLRTQVELHSALAEVPALAAMLPWRDPEAVVRALADAVTRDRVREAFAAAGWVSDAALDTSATSAAGQAVDAVDREP